MAVVYNPGGFPTISEVARVLSDPRVGLGEVRRADVFDACKARGVNIFQSRIDSAKLADVYFELCYTRGITERPA